MLTLSILLSRFVFVMQMLINKVEQKLSEFFLSQKVNKFVVNWFILLVKCC